MYYTIQPTLQISQFHVRISRRASIGSYGRNLSGKIPQSLSNIFFLFLFCKFGVANHPAVLKRRRFNIHFPIVAIIKHKSNEIIIK